MGYIKTKGIVIKEVNTGEADRIITIFSKSHGRISGAAKGARRTKSKFVASTALLCYSDFVLYKGREIYSISSADVIEPFYELRNDVVKLTYSAHILELVNDAIQENQPSSKLLQLVLNTLHMLAKSNQPPELLIRIFELRMLKILGYAPHVNNCTMCGADEGEMNFSFRHCGLLCRNCGMHDKLSIRINPGTVKALQHIIYSAAGELFNFSVSDSVQGDLERILKRYLRERLEKDYKKLDFLKTL